MKARLTDIEIVENKPFANCKLGRVEYANILTKVVQTYTDGCVFSLTGEWGCGKTTFVKMWQQSLTNQGFPTLYFNAWEDDFVSDPIVALLGQLKALDESDEGLNAFKSICQLALGIFNVVTNGGMSNFKDGADVITETSVDEFAEYLNKHQLLDDLKDKLVSYIQSATGDTDEFKPLVFFIDELDRCNPTYAVKVLERVKHLFNIPNIVFVLSVDKEQLCNSIRGYYGSDLINANEYLKRFIDIEYYLPEPDVKKFCDYLYETYEFDAFFASDERKQYFQRKDEKEEFLRMAVILFGQMRLNLRQMEKIFAHIRLALLTFRENYIVHPGLLLMVMFFRTTNRDFYNKLVSQSIKAQEVLDVIEGTFPSTLFVENEYTKYTTYRHAVWEVARLIVSYNLDMNQRKSEELLIKVKTDDSTGSKAEPSLKLKPKIIPSEDLLEAIKCYEENIIDNRVLPINYITQHLELLSSIN